MACKCSSFCITELSDVGNHHHAKCQKYKTEKFPYLFYMSDAVNAWIPAPERLENIIEIPSDLDNG